MWLAQPWFNLVYYIFDENWNIHPTKSKYIILTHEGKQLYAQGVLISLEIFIMH